MTITRKIKIYRKSRYRCPAPPVNTALWTVEDWARWIDQYNGWRI